MSEKDMKETPMEETPETAEQPAAPVEETAAAEETFTVTKSQMEQMEQLAKVLADANDKYWRRNMTTTASAPPAKRSTSTARPRPTPSSHF